MATEHPITRAELREEFTDFRQEIERTLQHYATKADLERLKVWMLGSLATATAVIIGAMRFFA